MRTEKKKSLGYLGPQYRDIGWDSPTDICEIPAFKAVIEEFRERASHTKQPCWPVKYASLYLTFQEKYYALFPSDLRTSDEIFEVLVDDLKDRLYELGAYDMFYGGMLD